MRRTKHSIVIAGMRGLFQPLVSVFDRNHPLKDKIKEFYMVGWLVFGADAAVPIVSGAIFLTLELLVALGVLTALSVPLTTGIGVVFFLLSVAFACAGLLAYSYISYKKLAKRNQTLLEGKRRDALFGKIADEQQRAQEEGYGNELDQEELDNLHTWFARKDIQQLFESDYKATVRNFFHSTSTKFGDDFRFTAACPKSKTTTKFPCSASASDVPSKRAAQNYYKQIKQTVLTHIYDENGYVKSTDNLAGRSKARKKAITSLERDIFELDSSNTARTRDSTEKAFILLGKIYDTQASIDHRGRLTRPHKFFTHSHLASHLDTIINEAHDEIGLSYDSLSKESLDRLAGEVEEHSILDKRNAANPLVPTETEKIRKAAITLYEKFKHDLTETLIATPTI